jgi:hypothetical protein
MGNQSQLLMQFDKNSGGMPATSDIRSHLDRLTLKELNDLKNIMDETTEKKR